MVNKIYFQEAFGMILEKATKNCFDEPTENRIVLL